MKDSLDIEKILIVIVATLCKLTTINNSEIRVNFKSDKNKLKSPLGTSREPHQ